MKFNQQSGNKCFKYSSNLNCDYETNCDTESGKSTNQSIEIRKNAVINLANYSRTAAKIGKDLNTKSCGPLLKD